MCRKHKYPTSESAAGARRKLVAKGKAFRGSLDIYFCKKCKSYHLGHRSNTEKIGPALWNKIKTHD